MKIPSIKQIWQSIVQTFKRFPFAVTAAVVGTIITIYAIKENLHDDWVGKIMMIASLSVFFFTALALASEVVKKISREFAMVIGALLMVLYFFILPEDLDFLGQKMAMRHAFFMLASFVAIIWAPFWKEKIKNETIWEWVRQIIMNLVQTIFFGIVIFAGIAAALFALKSLFGFDFDGETYFQLWTAIVGAFGPLYFLSNLDKNPRKLSVPKPIPTFMKVLTKYILTPLAIGYFIILYTYTFKVLITWEWPKNLLSWLVIGFSIVAVFTYFLWTPFWKEKIAKYRRLFWWGLLPQIAMLFVAIIWRIKEYSWTENRYFVVILGLWLLGISIYFLINKKATFKSIFVALTAIILVSQIGPMSGYSVGERAQKTRLVTLLESAQILKNGEIIPAKIELDKSVRYEISDTIDYLVRRHGKDSVIEIFPEILAKLEENKKVYRYELAQNITKELGFKFVSDWEIRSTEIDIDGPISFNMKWDSPRKIAGYDWFIQSINKHREDDNILSFGDRKINIKLDSDKKLLEIYEGKILLEKVDFTDFFAGFSGKKLSSKRETPNNAKEGIMPIFIADNQLSAEELSYEYEGENIKLKALFPYLTIRKEKVEYFDLQLYLSFK